MMVIEKIKGIIKKEKLDNMKNVFYTTEPSIAKHLSNDIKPYIISNYQIFYLAQLIILKLLKKFLKHGNVKPRQVRRQLFFQILTYKSQKTIM